MKKAMKQSFVMNDLHAMLKMKCVIRALICFIALLSSFCVSLVSAQEKGYEAIAKGDFSTALRELITFAEKGEPKAQFAIGVLYDAGQGIAKDQAIAAKWHLRAARQNYALAQLCLGSLYQSGQGLERNSAEAISWYKAAAAQGEMNAFFCLGGLYETGRGVSRDTVEAAKWFEQACLRGHTQAMGRYSVLLFKKESFESKSS
jgi:TPR repeat protein